METKEPKIKTLGELKKSGYKPRGIKDELRENLVTKLKNKEETFAGIFGYETSVIPELERAILSRHNINLLGLRGQAKTRLARLMVNLLDEWMPIVEGSEINDDPFAPLSYFAKELVEKQKDNTPISWIHRDERFAEKLATPDVTIADLIGDVDPIKAANLKLSYADERVIHFGMIPRANRCIFVINELPDLQARIQVGLFNILQEGDLQIRGFKLRFPLDIQFVFTANPEDYTNRGSIVTPLKDRIGSQILTHYPETIEIARKITAQEVRSNEGTNKSISIPVLAKDLIEQIGFEARKSEYVDIKSGISARMSISAYENLVSAAELRMLKQNKKQTIVRLGDFIGIIPALTGKMEIAYEGEQEGARFVAEYLIQMAVKGIFESMFPKVLKLEKQGVKGPYHDVISWFDNLDDEFELTENMNDEEYKKQLDKIVPLDELIDKYQGGIEASERYFLKEIVLWGLAENKKLSRVIVNEGISFGNNYNDLLKDLNK
ncbi:MAG TPA: magnesium chelatase [Bacteroidia bacterium]|nr:magnesium chelatase [Bacteroidia bacterium]